jgi:hypothetical protein
VFAINRGARDYLTNAPFANFPDWRTAPLAAYRVPCPSALLSFHSPTYLLPSESVFVPCPLRLSSFHSPTYFIPVGNVFVPCPSRLSSFYRRIFDP